MFERPAPALLLAAIVVGWLLHGVRQRQAGGIRARAARRQPAAAGARIRQPRQPRRSRCGGAPRVARAPGGRAPRRSRAERAGAALRPLAGIEKGTPGKLLIFSSVTGHVPIGDVRRPTAGTPEERENAARGRSSSVRSKPSALAKSSRARREPTSRPGRPLRRMRIRRAGGARGAAASRARSGAARERDHQRAGGKLGQCRGSPRRAPQPRPRRQRSPRGDPLLRRRRRTRCCAARKTAISTATPTRGVATNTASSSSACSIPTPMAGPTSGRPTRTAA